MSLNSLNCPLRSLIGIDHVQTTLPPITLNIVCVSFRVSHSPEYKKSCSAKPLPGKISGTTALAAGRCDFDLSALSTGNCANENAQINNKNRTGNKNITDPFCLDTTKTACLYEENHLTIYHPGFCG